ncbi:hypothetical protein AMATHDRAFT_38597 [Amanita thiersii Skay4041]|uniref:F-box domain-containing protein n=1 Tax=Amanita thiersii Skay4041 TaxID=703135 RepID=A0A2A9NTA1_9AGAR|nr:hypothetical protein AMATHDRAFT_38597 [Amanita thiersii Skay4041]
MMTAVPEEILDRIFSFLESDLPTLKACSLVCSSFLRLVRVRLFSSLKLHILEGGQLSHDHQQLCAVFEACPELILLVRHLRLFYSPNLTSQPALGLYQHPNFLESMLRLKSIQLRCAVGICWQMVSDTMHQTFLTLFRSDTLTHIDFVRIEVFPLSLLGHCRSVKSLRLAYVTFLRGDVYIGNPPIYIQSLDVELYTEELAFLTQWFLHTDSSLKLNYLRELRIKLEQKVCSQYAWALLQASSASIEKLIMDPSCYGNNSITLFNAINGSLTLNLPKDLSSIHLQLQFLCRLGWSPAQGYCDPLPWVVNAFRTFSSSNSLERIGITCLFDHDNADIEYRHGSMQCWSDLDDIVAHMPSPGLKQVDIRVWCHACSDGLLSNLQSRLPLLYSRGLLQLSIDPSVTSITQN